MNKLPPPSAAVHGKPVAAVTLALLIVLCGRAHSSTFIQITPDDPSTTSDVVVPSSGWNVLKPLYSSESGLDDYAVSNLLDSTGAPTGISLAADDTNRFNAYNRNGSTVASLGFPADVKRESFFGNDVAYNTFVRPKATWVFGGFNPADNLTFTFFASRMVVDQPIDNREGKYEVVGATPTSTTLNARDNDANTVSVTVKADASGNVVLNMTKGLNNTNEFGFFYLTAMTITVNGNKAPVAQDALLATAENSPLATVVGSVSASDPDATDVLGYAITAGNADSKFAIDPLTGEITVAGALDFETTPQYVLTVTVTDNGVPALSETATITINVSDVNESLQAFNKWLDGFGPEAEPSDDSDAGGLNNHVEFLFGYDPTDPADDLPFRLELVLGEETIVVIYPELKPVGDYHLSKAVDPALLTDPVSRVETITKAQIEAMSAEQRSSRTYTGATGVREFFRLEFVPPPLE
jgi:hypothetical protein